MIKFKKQLKAEKRTGGASGLEDILDGDMSLGNILKMVKNNPEIIDQVKNAIGGLKQNKAIDDRSGLGNNFRWNASAVIAGSTIQKGTPDYIALAIVAG